MASAKDSGSLPPVAARQRRSSLTNSFKAMLSSAGLKEVSKTEQRPRRESTATQLELMKELESVEALMKNMTEVSKTIVQTHKRTQQVTLACSLERFALAGA